MGEAICWACGYNLRGNVSGICPECGKPAYSASAELGDGREGEDCHD
ncbi:MAG: hypothetical protein GXP29_08160 [Planctomycetes bacterium]|nr:hypothetical protein [Planctomycetota bacterium]